MKGAEYIRLMESEEIPTLSKNDLIHIAGKYNFNDEKRKRIQPVLFQYITKHAVHYQRADLSNNLLPTYINRHYSQYHKQNYEYFYSSIPEKEVFRCFIEVKTQMGFTEKALLEYMAKKPGSLQDMYNAREFIHLALDKPLTTSVLSGINELSVAGRKPFKVYESYHDLIGFAVTPGTFREDLNKDINIKNSCVSPLGLVEINKYFKEFADFAPGYGQPENRGKSLYAICKNTTKSMYATVTNVLAQYENTLDRIDISPSEILDAIVNMVQTLSRMKPFYYGNTHTFGPLVLNRELVRNGFRPSLLIEYDRLIGFNHDECLMEIVYGMDYFEKLSSTGTLPNCMSSEKLLAQIDDLPIKVSSSNHLKL